MANLTIRNDDDDVIRNVDDDVVEPLKPEDRDTAALEAEIRQMLAERPQRPLTGAEMLKLARKISALTPNVPQTDSVELLREDRDR